MASMGIFTGKTKGIPCNGSTSPSGRKRKAGGLCDTLAFSSQFHRVILRKAYVRQDEKLGPVLTVSGVDLLDGTPLVDIKPYLPYADAHPEAKGGFAEKYEDFRIPVIFPEELLIKLPEKLRQTAMDVLAQDPRAACNRQPDYVYGMAFDDYDIRFVVSDGQLVVKDVKKRNGELRKVK